MKKKHVTTIRLTDQQLTALLEEAERLGLSIAEVVRRAIDQYLKGRES